MIPDVRDARFALVRAVQRLAALCLDAGPRAAALISFGAGAASVLALAPFFLWPVLFVTLPILIWMIDRSQQMSGSNFFQRLSAAFLPGWFFGFGYFVFGLFWIGEAFLVEADRFLWALPFAVTLLPAGLAIFFGAATAVAGTLSRPGVERVIAFAITLSAAEWLRGHILTGFPWNILGYALTMPLVLMQSAGLIGIYGLTLVAVVVGAAPAVIVAESKSNSLLSALAVWVVPLAVMTAYGSWRLASIVDADVPGVRLRIVQPSIPQREKWLPENQRRIFFEHIELSKQRPDGVFDDVAGATHVIWPEAAMPFRPLQSPEALALIGQLLPVGKLLLSGGLRTLEPQPGVPEARNSLMVFDSRGEAVSIYDKIHLVPFGEYLPLRILLEKVGLQQLTRQRGGFGAGPSPRQLLSLPGLPIVSPLICYEAIFPGALVQGGERPGVLINITNDGWFGNTTGPRQHLHQARIRAVEEGVPLVRAANNGISAVVAPSGRIVVHLGLNIRGSIDTNLPQSVAAPPYAAYGDWIFLVLLLLFCGVFVVFRSNCLRGSPDS